MPKAKTNSSTSDVKRRPALTPEAEEAELVSLATDLAREQLLNKTASSQVITHYLKLGTTKAILENDKLRQENELLRAKTESLQSAQKSEELYEKVIAAMMEYSGRGGEEDEREEY